MQISNNKQNSIEKMFQEMLGIQQEGIKLTFDENLALLEKYKAMHKEEIRKAYCYGEHYKDTKLTTDYYNETYGGNNEQL